MNRDDRECGKMVTYQCMDHRKGRRHGLDPTSPETRLRYPHVVELELIGGPRDPRKAWLYSTYCGSQWIAQDMMRTEYDLNTNGLLIRTDAICRWYCFADEQEALMFRLRWSETPNKINNLPLA